MAIVVGRRKWDRAIKLFLYWIIDINTEKLYVSICIDLIMAKSHIYEQVFVRLCRVEFFLQHNIQQLFLLLYALLSNCVLFRSKLQKMYQVNRGKWCYCNFKNYFLFHIIQKMYIRIIRSKSGSGFLNINKSTLQYLLSLSWQNLHFNAILPTL